ncbi:hypothetical protein RHODO2019_06440 [Rhodococcus antarcticus]|uniref:Uncharacterized protein n=1 Tax=Rhodococcus antarcticus TaxID=2987751 RepID=A0ABY6P336_9NOCA|nr:hypothetical protein [Rhodococcus antarcticus]UZJ26065.1 hypothetical protein RHODO2019_06440 [Rhodococcus antarcticus]
MLDGPRRAPCQQKYGTTFVDTINNQTNPALVNTLSAVRAKAPHAKVVILGYPQIPPPPPPPGMTPAPRLGHGGWSP